MKVIYLFHLYHFHCSIIGQILLIFINEFKNISSASASYNSIYPQGYIFSRKLATWGGGIIIAKNQKGGRMNRNVQKIKENVKKGGRFFRKGGGITSSSRENIYPCNLLNIMCECISICYCK